MDKVISFSAVLSIVVVPRQMWLFKLKILTIQYSDPHSTCLIASWGQWLLYWAVRMCRTFLSPKKVLLDRAVLEQKMRIHTGHRNTTSIQSPGYFPNT